MNARLLVALAVPLVFAAPGPRASQLSAEPETTIVNAAEGVEVPTVVSTIAFTSARDNYFQPWAVPAIVGGEIYLIDYMSNGTFAEPIRVTSNMYTDIFPTLSPDGRGKVVFDSNRLRAAGEPVNVSDLFLMNHDGTEVRFLTRGGSPTWAPPGPNGEASKNIAFHASASGAGLPVNRFPGSATADSDIFTVNVDDLLENGAAPRNLTINRAATVDDDPNWSPDGQKIIFTSYVNENPASTLTSSEIYIMNADGSGQAQLTDDRIEKRGAAWSPDGKRILFARRSGEPNRDGIATFEACVMDAVPNGAVTQLTHHLDIDPTNLTHLNALTPTWSPDGKAIVFHWTPANQLWVMNADGSGQVQLTSPPGNNLLATSWSVIAVGRRGH